MLRILISNKCLKYFHLCLVSILFFAGIQLASTQAASPGNIEKLFNYAETAPDLFFPPSQTRYDVANWVYRYYSSTDSYVGINLSDPFTPPIGGIFLLGGSFGNQIRFFESLENILKVMETNPGLINSGNENCAMLPPTAVVRSAFYNLTASNGGIISTLTQQQDYLVTSRNLTQVRTREQGSVGDVIKSRLRVVNTFINEVNGKRTIPGIETTETNLTPFGDTTITKKLAFEPGLFDGPPSIYCEGMAWSEGIVTQKESIFTFDPNSPNSTSTSKTTATTVTVESVFDYTSTRAGNFNTIRIVRQSASTIETEWIDVATGVVVKSISSNPGNNDYTARELFLIF